MRIALLFRGVSYAQYTHWTNKQLSIDFRDNIVNVKKMLIEPLRGNHEVDIFYTTYKHSLLHLLAYELEPKAVDIIPDTELTNRMNHNVYVLQGMKNALNLLGLNNNYDVVILTRFDINFLENIAHNLCETRKLLFLCKANGQDKTITYNDDSLIVIPKQYFQHVCVLINKYIRKDIKLGHHLLYNELCKQIPCDFLYNSVHEIALDRPILLFNREVPYRNESHIISLNNPRIPFVLYRTSGYSYVTWKNPNSFRTLKAPNETIALKFNWAQQCQYLQINFHIQQHTPDMLGILVYGSSEEHVIRPNGTCSFEIRTYNSSQHNIEFHFKGDFCSMVDINNLEIIPKTHSKIHFVSFYTEGYPNDLCMNMIEAKNTYENAIKPFVDTVRFISAKELRCNPESEPYVRVFNTTPNPYNPGVHLIGFLKWKPFVILKALENADDNDVIYYRDGNIIKYPSIAYNLHETKELVEKVLHDNDSIMFVPVENYPDLKMKHNVKREIFDELGEYNDNYLESYLFNSSIVICRKCPQAIEIMKEWLEGCKKDHLIQFETDTMHQHPEFKWNVQEQSILNVVLKKNIISGNLPSSFPKYSLINRSFTKKDLLKIPRIAVLISGEMRNFDNDDVLKMNEKYLFDRHKCDIFVSTWTKRGSSFNHGNISSKDYANNEIKEDDIRSAYRNVKGIHIEDYDTWYRSLDSTLQQYHDKGFYNCGSEVLCPGTAIPQLYKLWDSNNLKKQYELQNNFQYDIVVRFRGDFCMVETLSPDFLKIFLKCFDVDPTHDNTLFHLNPANIYEPSRVYDIFFYGSSRCMDIISETWNNVSSLIHHEFDNGLASTNACRLLYVHSIMNGIKVIDIPRAIGDIYRDEPIEEYIHKVKEVFNRDKKDDAALNSRWLYNKQFKGISTKFLPRKN